MTDVVVIGGGVIGLSVAYELAGQGGSVRVLEQGELGREASWAGAGILPPGNPARARSPHARLRAESHRLWPHWSRELRETTGIDNGYRHCGGLEVRRHGPAGQLREAVAFWQDEGVEVEELTGGQLREHEPALNPELAAGYRLPGVCQVRNPWHLKALIAGCAARGVELLPGRPVVGFERRGGRIAAALTPDGAHPAGRFCVAGGAWSRQLLAEAGCDVGVEPVRGQIVLLSARPLPFRHVIEVGPRYLVPRADGRVLVGSTEEWVGFDKRTTAGAIGELLRFAIDLVPALGQAACERTWAGLRPGSPDGLPYLGRVPGTDNLFVAAGHFRSGLQMSPATAVLMRQLLLDEEPFMPVDAFACERRGGAAASCS